MQTRKVRACGIAAAGLLTALATSGVSADTPNTPQPETSLLGVRLMASFSDVMRKFGQPNEIQVGEPTISGQGQSAPAGGGMAGGPRRGGMMGGMMGGPGMGSSMGAGYPGMGGGRLPGMNPGGMMGSSPGAMMGSGGGGSYPGMNPGGMMGSSPGAMMGSGGGGGLPGLGGRPGGMGMPGMNPGNAGAGAEDSGESTWWYHFPQKGLHYSFLFNKDGRVIQIQAYGQKADPKIVAPRTAQGITLGTELGQVIRKYGWSNDGEHSGDYVVMRYGKRDQVAFQMRRNKVLGIVLGRVNPQAPPPAYAGGPGFPGGGYPGGGYPGGPGAMMGRGMGGGGGE